MDRWEQVNDLFLAAAELAPQERDRFLAGACMGDPSLREELEALLAADARSDAGIADAIAGAARELVGGEGIIDSRIGAYRIVGEIGAGGMGNVYLAVRADDQYQKKVAIKLIRRGLDTDDMLDRFRHERQILANLEHPYIARLLDGGTAPDGRPFLVMEYVEGKPLDAYCNAGDLDLRQRCRLFLKVCEAVAYAHHSLVVHRDLKPGNILVTADGSPKLLDFGLAKLLDPEIGAEHTLLGSTRPLTPEYASPELIRGETITTATDVYSLGAILYRLLSGQCAQTFVTYSPREIERVICEVEPPRLSEASAHWSRQLRGDLDAIVSMAMRKEPGLRYATVEHLAADLNRYLDGWAVAARQGSGTYRARKFVRRHRVAILASGLFVTVLITGATTAAMEARRATREQVLAEASQKKSEQAALDAQRERTEADTQRQIADRRFQQVRQLAGKFLLDFHDAIANLPGSTPARKMVVETGLQYYDTLVREAHGNREILEEVARGYDRLGDVQGNPYFANLGDTAGAIVSYRKAVAVRAGISDPSPEFLRDRMLGNVKLAQAVSTGGDVRSGARILRETLALGRAGPNANAYAVLDALATAYGAYGDLYARTADYNQSIEPFTEQLRLREQLAKEKRDPVAERIGISLAQTKLGDSYAHMERSEDALPHLRTAIAIDQEIADADPNNLSRKRKLFIDYSLLGMAFRMREELAAPGEARSVMQTACDIGERMSAADPNNITALMDVSMSHIALGDWLRHQREFDAALKHYQVGLADVQKIAATATPSLIIDDALVQAYHRYGTGLDAAGRPQEALQEFARGEEVLNHAKKQNTGLTRLAKREAEIASSKGDAYSHQQQWKEAIAAYGLNAAIYEDLARRDSNDEALRNAQPGLYIKLADAKAAVSDFAGARTAAGNALAVFEQIASRRALTADEDKQRQDALSKLQAWKQN